MKPEDKKQIAKALLDAANALSASSGSATLRVWHGTDAMFDDFDLSKAGSRDPGWLGRGLYFSTDPRVAQGFKRQVQAIVRLNNPLTLKMPDWKTHKFNVAREALGLPFERGITDAGARALTAEAQRRGFDGVILDYSPAGYFHQEVAAFHPKSVTITSSGPVSASSQVARKDNGRPRGTFVGSADGWEYTEDYPLGLRGGWAASIGLSSSNDWMNLSVEGATEYDDSFRNALREIVAEYPEIAQYVVSFDGPYIPVSKLLEMKSKDFRDIVFLHGTSSAVVPRIMAEGLRPRSETGIEPAYGYASSAKPSIPNRVYLTTQLTMAKAAARNAARVHGGEPVVLEVTGLNVNHALPDEDSGAKTAEESLAKLGSIAYSRTIPTSKIRAVNGKLSAATGWHGSHKAFELFDISKVRRGEFGPGFYFADDKEEAERYGPAKQYSLDIEAPLEVGNRQHLDVLLAAFPIEQRYKDLISKSSVGFETLFNLLEQKYKMPPETVISHLQSLGFDGIRVNGEQKFWVAFSPEQIKQP